MKTYSINYIYNDEEKTETFKGTEQELKSYIWQLRFWGCWNIVTTAK